MIRNMIAPNAATTIAEKTTNLVAPPWIRRDPKNVYRNQADRIDNISVYRLSTVSGQRRWRTNRAPGRPTIISKTEKITIYPILLRF